MWRMTPYKILALFRIHREFNPDRFKPEEKEADIDDVLGGLEVAGKDVQIKTEIAVDGEQEY